MLIFLIYLVDYKFSKIYAAYDLCLCGDELNNELTGIDFCLETYTTGYMGERLTTF